MTSSTQPKRDHFLGVCNEKRLFSTLRHREILAKTSKSNRQLLESNSSFYNFYHRHLNQQKRTSFHLTSNHLIIIGLKNVDFFTQDRFYRNTVEKSYI